MNFPALNAVHERLILSSMSHVRSNSTWSASFSLAALLLTGFTLLAAELPSSTPSGAPKIFPASNEGELSIKKFELQPGFRAELWAAEPMFANPVSFAIDEKGRIFVAETFRLHKGVTDIRQHMNWLDEELAAKSTDDLRALFKKYDVKGLTDYSERVTLLEDRTGSGRASHATVFADGIFNSPVDGIGAGLLARNGSVYFANIPNLWLLQDTKGTGTADMRKPLHTGFGVRVGFLGHDLHGLRIGPDGQLYFSIGDRGASIKTLEGKLVNNPEAGCIYRCDLDGSNLEIFHYGLRNPQELVFDEFGNLWTGDNNSDGGDPARWVYAVEGGDSGWRVGWQFIESAAWTTRRGPWLGERMCYPQFDGQAAFIVPPIENIGNGPSGLTYNPGIGLPTQYDGHFFLVDFKGGSANSGIHSFAVKPKGAGFEVTDLQHFVWNALATDADFGYDGHLYFSDWVDGWGMPSKGRIYRLAHTEAVKNPVIGEVTKLFAEGFEKRSVKELVALLSHGDQRVRQEAQFALVDKSAANELSEVAAKSKNRLARLHAVWGLGQCARKDRSHAKSYLAPVEPLLADSNAEVRAQAAKVLGDYGMQTPKTVGGLRKLLADPSPRVRSFAAIALGKIRVPEAFPSLVTMLRDAADKDPVLRHAGVSGLVGCGDAKQVAALRGDASPAVRMAAVVALRRLESAEVGAFLADKEPGVVMEAARAIAEVPITGALPQLAVLTVAGGTTHASLPPSSSQRAANGPETRATPPSSGFGRRGFRPRPALLASDPLLRRVLAANFRLGTPESAKRLAAVAADNDSPEGQRLEALDELANWAKPSGRDRITGLWRPIAPRDEKPAADAIANVASDLLRSAPDSVRAVAASLAGQYSVKAAGPALFELLSNNEAAATTRAEALKALGKLNDAKLAEAVKLASADSNETLRKEATTLMAKLGGGGGGSVAPFIAALATGTIGERQSALDQLASFKDSSADEVILAQFDKLLTGQLPSELTLELLEAAAKRSSPEIKARLQKFEASRDAKDPLAPWSTALAGGNAEAGRKILYERAEASCFRCHKVGNEGGEVGPVLTDVAKRLTREQLLESIALPNARIAEGFESVIVTLKTGVSFAGVLKSENDKEIVVNSPEDGLLKLAKTDIAKKDRGLSPMPAELANVLSRRDLRDLIEFLASLK
jgi:quinoprotein glucose dehydrogenase